MMKIIIMLLMMLTTYINYDNNNVITMNCNGEVSKININIQETFSCTLLNNEYVFNISDIKDNKIYIKINEYGLTTTSSLLEKQNKFTIKKGDEVKLKTQTTDYQEFVSLKWYD